MKNLKYKWHILIKLLNLINIGIKKCWNIKPRLINYKDKLLLGIKHKCKSFKNKYNSLSAINKNNQQKPSILKKSKKILHVKKTMSKLIGFKNKSKN